MICERCGAKMILRHSPYRIFWGCSNYPVCEEKVRYNSETENSDEEK